MKLGSKFLALGLLAAALVSLNYVAGSLPVRGDLTAGRIYTLSPGTRELLKQIEEPITLDFYYSRATGGLRVAEKNYAARVEEMLRAYVRAADGKLALNVITPEPDTPAEERAQAAGLQPVNVPGSGEPFYLGVVALQADQQKSLPTLSPQRESFLEYDLSTLIHSVQQLKKPRLGLLTSLPLQAQPDFMMMQQRRPSRGQLVVTEWAKSFEIVKVEADATTLPADLAALVVVHPQGVSAKLEYAIDQFLLGGKPVLLAVDPASSHFKRQGGQQAMFGGPQPNVSSDLPRLLKAYGVTYDAQQVVGDLRLATPVNAGGGQVARMPVWLSLTAEQLSATAQPTAQLGSLLFVEGGSFTVAEGTGREVTPLVRTTASAGTTPGFTLQFAQPDDIAKSLTAGGQELTLAALIRGPFTSAFPDGAPKDEPKSAADGQTPPAPAPAADATVGLKSGTGTLLLVADTDWLLDDFSVQRMPFLGQEIAQPLNDNLFFGANTVEFLAGAPQLIGLRGKASPQRPFTVVADMEAAARDRYNEKLADLEKRLADVQAKLSELQGKSGEAGRLVATPEMLKTIEEFQAQELAMRRERRDIRRALREDVDALENKLLAVNLLAPAALVSAFGWWFARRRRRA